MLPSLPYDEKVKVLNKGVDITIIVNEETEEIAMKASRNLVVSGKSTAILLITDLENLDYKTIYYYERITGAFVFADENLFNKIIPVLQHGTIYGVLNCPGIVELSILVREIIAQKNKTNISTGNDARRMKEAIDIIQEKTMN